MSSLSTAAGTVSAISSSTQGIVDVLGRLAGGDYFSQLRPASYRGVPFVTIATGATFGRRNAVHEYPNRDTPWIEDLGRQARKFTVQGFLIGDDVIAQRDRMIAACEKKGDGELVHTTYGRRTVALMSWSVEEHRDHGRVFHVSFTFIEQGKRQYPSAATSGEAAIGTAAKNLNTMMSSTFVGKVLTVLSNGAGVANQVAQQAAAYANQALQIANDATSLVKLSVGLVGDYGRLLGLASGVAVGEVVAGTAGLTTADLTGKAAAARESVQTACDALTSAAAAIATGNPADTATAAVGVVNAVLAASSTPGDAIRNLASLCAFAPTGVAFGDELVAQQATVLALQRAAVAAIAQASSQYQPASTDDAAAIRVSVLAALDTAITTAGDAGEDSVFTALRALRAIVVQDLNVRGAQLPTLVSVRMDASLPSLVLAQRLYRDATRADELVRRAAPVHPGFMPRSFQALNQ